METFTLAKQKMWFEYLVSKLAYTFGNFSLMVIPLLAYTAYDKINNLSIYKSYKDIFQIICVSIYLYFGSIVLFIVLLNLGTVILFILISLNRLIWPVIKAPIRALYEHHVEEKKIIIHIRADNVILLPGETDGFEGFFRNGF